MPALVRSDPLLLPTWSEDARLESLIMHAAKYQRLRATETELLGSRWSWTEAVLNQSWFGV
jgi:hypothetical protein